jgi:hypothetical protein
VEEAAKPGDATGARPPFTHLSLVCAATMGANESRSHGHGHGQAAPDVEDYYKLLGVDENATADEIKVGACCGIVGMVA